MATLSCESPYLEGKDSIAFSLFLNPSRSFTSSYALEFLLMTSPSKSTSALSFCGARSKT